MNTDDPAARSKRALGTFTSLISIVGAILGVLSASLTEQSKLLSYATEPLSDFLTGLARWTNLDFRDLSASFISLAVFYAIGSRTRERNERRLSVAPQGTGRGEYQNCGKVS